MPTPAATDRPDRRAHRARFAMAALGALVAGAVLAASAAHAADPAVLAAQERRTEVVAKAAPSVVAIFNPNGQGGGSGVLITPDGYALTNFHVTSGAGNFMKCGLNDGVLYDAVIVGIDPTGDVAMIKLLGREDFPFAPLGDSDKVRVGDWTYAMGNPFLLATDFRPTVTYGIVSGVNRYQYPSGTFLEYTDCIQIDTSINPGNSGGPLFDETGAVIGINGRGSFEKRGRVNSGAGYAISINQIKNFMDHLRSGRIVDHATLGATVATRSDGAVIVGSILEQSEAYRRGLRIDDEIVNFAGRPMRSVNQFKNILGIYPKGWVLPLTYRRDDRKEEIYVRLRGLHRESELTPGGGRPKPAPAPKDDKPKDGEKPKDGPKPAVPPRVVRPTAPPPEKYKHMFVTKEGYANWWFNQLEQERVLKSVKALGDFAKATGTWEFEGKTATGDPAKFTLAKEILGLDLGRTVALQKLDGSDFEDEPKGSGGLLVALHHLRLLLSDGAKKFTEFQYLGSEPLDGRGEPVDVLVAELAETESRWYFSKASGAFLGFDLRLGPDVDDCRIRFGELKDFGGRKFPASFTVTHGGLPYGAFVLDRIDWDAAAKKAGE